MTRKVAQTTLGTAVGDENLAIRDVVTSFTAERAHLIDKRQRAASVTVPFRHCCWRGLEKSRGAPAVEFLVGERALGTREQMYSSFTKPVGDLISFLAPQAYQNDNSRLHDHPWRRHAYDRTLTCPDLARVINDFLSSDIDFIPEEDFPVRLCA